MIFHYSFTFLHRLRVYDELTMWPAPRWLDSSVGRALLRYHRGHGFESPSGLNFFQALISQLLKQLNYLCCKLKTQIHDPTASHQYTSILINLFIKVELNILLLPPVLSTVFVPKTSGHTFWLVLWGC